MRVPRVSEVRLDRRDAGMETLAAGLGLSLLDILLGLEPLLPVGQPCLVILAFVRVDIEAPSHLVEPLVFQSV